MYIATVVSCGNPCSPLNIVLDVIYVIDTEKKCMLQEGIDQLFRALNHTDQSIRHRKPKFQSLEPMIHLFLLFFFSVKPVQDWHSRKHTERNAHF